MVTTSNQGYHTHRQSPQADAYFLITHGHGVTSGLLSQTKISLQEVSTRCGYLEIFPPHLYTRIATL